MTRLCTLVLFVALLTAYAADAGGKTSPSFGALAPEQRVNLKADAMYYDQKTNLYTAEGSVVVEQEGSVLKADKITIDTVTQDAQAIGNVSLQEAENVLTCERLTVNLDTKVGTVAEATLFVKENNYHIKGRSFQKLGENSYKVLNGTVTTCDGTRPDWKITGGEIDVTLEKYATIKNSTFQILNVPIMYFPYFMYPVKTKRQSGMLIPEISHSSSDGLKIDNSFFWAISDSTDATFFVDYATERGVGEGTEYRYVLSPQSKGKLYQYYTEERSEYFDDEYDDPLDRDRKRGIVDFEGEHYFNETSYAKAKGTWLSDREMYKDYGGEIGRSKSEWDSVSIRTREKSESLLFYTKNWSSYSLTANADYYKDLTQRDTTTLQRLPSIQLSGLRDQILQTPLFFKLDSAYDYFRRHEGVEGQRIDVFPKISLPLTFGKFVKFTPQLGARGMFAMDLSQEEDGDYDHQKTTLDASAELSTTILRVYNFPGSKVSKLKHSIEPSIMYQYIPDDDQEDFPFFDPVEQFYDRHAVTYALTNRFIAKQLQADGNYAEQELGYFKISQNYYFTQPDLPWTVEGYNGRDLSDIISELRLQVARNASLKAELYFNPYDQNLSSYNAYVLLQNKRDDFLRFEYRYRRDELEGFRVKGRLMLHPSWIAHFDTRRSEFSSKTLDSLYGLEYLAQCWSIRLNFEEKAKQAGKDRETKYTFLFNLAGLSNWGKAEKEDKY
jgi:LPS-assembly protein